MISFQDGKILRSNSTNSVTFPLNPQQTLINNAQTGGCVSTFSSWGPTNEVNINPHFGAPGGGIYSTFPLPLGGYDILSGTSMATPYVTGVIALYLACKGSKDPVKLRGLLGTTAVPMDWNDGIQTSIRLKAPVSQQGGGLINAFRFLKATTEFDPAFIELNVNIFITLLISRIQPISKEHMRSLSVIMQGALLHTTLAASLLELPLWRMGRVMDQLRFHLQSMEAVLYQFQSPLLLCNCPLVRPARSQPSSIYSMDSMPTYSQCIPVTSLSSLPP